MVYILFSGVWIKVAVTHREGDGKLGSLWPFFHSMIKARHKINGLVTTWDARVMLSSYKARLVDLQFVIHVVLLIID